MFFITLSFALFANALGANPAPSYAPAPHHTPQYKEEPEPYYYKYAVKDDYANTNFNKQESADANGAVTGSYQVYLPDGRVQTVTYTADHYNGYVADVKYEGEPKYEPYQPAHSAKGYAPAHPAPAYKPAPKYH